MTLTGTDLTTMVRKHFGRTPGRVITPGPRPEFTEEIVTEDVTPERAMRWIAATWVKYQNGRNFYPTQIDKIIDYAHLMERDMWTCDPADDPIDITNGTITGGRHRLHALLLSHTTQIFRVRYRTTKEKI